MNNPDSYEARLAEASNPATRTARLQELSLDEDLEIKRRVTLNPNTPVEALLRLVGSPNEEVMTRPIGRRGLGDRAQRRAGENGN